MGGKSNMKTEEELKQQLQDLKTKIEELDALDEAKR